MLCYATDLANASLSSNSSTQELNGWPVVLNLMGHFIDKRAANES